MRERGWIGRFLILLNLIRWIFFDITNGVQVAAFNTVFVMALVFIYEDWWSLIQWLIRIKKKVDVLAETPRFQTIARWVTVIFLPIMVVASIFLAFYYPEESGLNVIGICYGVFFLGFWLVLLKFWKKTE